MPMLHKLYSIAVGGTSVGAVEMVQNVELPTSAGHEETIKLFFQLIITIATLVGLFKKKQPTTSK